MPERLRDGEDGRILASELVPGDIVVLEEGDNILADARLLRESDLRTNNSTLTGESEPVPQNCRSCIAGGPDLDPDAESALRRARASRPAKAKAWCWPRGMSTELGQIAHLTQSVETTELSAAARSQIGRVATTVTQLSVVMGVVFFFIGLGLLRI